MHSLSQIPSLIVLSPDLDSTRKPQLPGHRGHAGLEPFVKANPSRSNELEIMRQGIVSSRDAVRIRQTPLSDGTSQGHYQLSTNNMFLLVHCFNTSHSFPEGFSNTFLSLGGSPKIKHFAFLCFSLDLRPSENGG